MCDLCRADGNYFHTPECVYDQLVSEYPVMWLRDSTRIGACYTLRELLSPEGMVLAIKNAPPVTGWRLRMRYNEPAARGLYRAALQDGCLACLPVVAG